MPLALDRQFSFDNFFGPGTEFVIASLRALIENHGERQIGLYGSAGSGKTHLLNAAAHLARQQQTSLQLYDASDLVELEADAFEGYDRCDVLAIDNLDRVAGCPDWEAVIYRLINRCRDGDIRLVYALSTRPAELQVELDDFGSRLQWGLLLELPRHDDASIRDILRRRARLLGLELSTEVLSYLLTHHARGLDTQMEILRRLDGASLSDQRRITIPLIKQTLEQNRG